MSGDYLNLKAGDLWRLRTYSHENIIFFVQLNLLQRKLAIEQLSRHLGLHQGLSTEEKVAKAKEYMQVYTNGLTLGLFQCFDYRIYSKHI